jgi:hypothetical protein
VLVTQCICPCLAGSINCFARQFMNGNATTLHNISDYFPSVSCCFFAELFLTGNFNTI